MSELARRQLHPSEGAFRDEPSLSASWSLLLVGRRPKHSLPPHCLSTELVNLQCEICRLGFFTFSSSPVPSHS